MAFESITNLKHKRQCAPHLTVYGTGTAKVVKKCLAEGAERLSVEVDHDAGKIRLRSDADGPIKLCGKAKVTFYISRAVIFRWGIKAGEPLVIPLELDPSGWWVGEVSR